MREGTLFLLLLGLSAALHAGILFLARAPQAPVPATQETILEIDLTPPDIIPTPEIAEETPQDISEPLEMPQDVALPETDTQPTMVDEDPFTDPTPEDIFMPQAPTRPTPQVRPTNPTVLMEYRDVLRAWLNRHKRYPRLAERRGVEGEPVLRLVIGRRGTVLKASLEQSSGSPVLDRAALDMVERAKPFPAFPDHVAETSLEYLIPISFTLQ